MPILTARRFRICYTARDRPSIGGLALNPPSWIRKRAGTLLPALAAAVLLGGCGQAAAPAAPAPHSGAGTRITFQSPQGTAVLAAGAALPAGYPAGLIPLPAGSRLSSSLAATTARHRQEWILTLTAPKTGTARLLADYRRRLTARGFTVRQSLSTGGGPGGFTELVLQSARWEVMLEALGGGQLLLTVQSR